MPKKCAYKDLNNQIELTECDRAQLNSYVCQKSIKKKTTEYGKGIIYFLIIPKIFMF